MVELIQSNIHEIRARLSELGWVDAEIAQLHPAGEGNMNRALRALLSDGSNIVLKQSVDHVAKYPQIAAPIERAQIEAAFYAAIEANDALATRMPRFIGYDPENHWIGLGYLDGCRDFTDIYSSDNLLGTELATTKTSLGQLLLWLSELHAFRPGVAIADNQAMRLLNHAHIFEIPFQSDANPAALGPNAKVLADGIIGDGELRRIVRQLGQLYLGEVSTKVSPALLHGDFYPGSWLRNNQHQVYVLDPEFAFMGPAEFDVGVFIAHLTLANLDGENIDTILREYNAQKEFRPEMARQFAGIEIIRRLLGVAQLPVNKDDASNASWLTTAKNYLSS